MNGKISINNSIAGQSILKVRSLLPALLAAFLALGLGFLGLSLNTRSVQAQGQRWQFTLPVTNTSTQTSIYTVTNLTTRTISVRQEFYAGGFPGGQFVAVLTDTHFLLERKIYALSRIPNFPPNFAGVVIISSDQPITGSTAIRAVALPTPVPPSPIPGGKEPLLPPLPLLNPERVEINWTLITYLIVGIFALSGFLKGWWKEAITTFFLGILIFFLAVPEAAEWFINAINSVIRFIAEQLSRLGFTIDTILQFDPGSGQTWLVILLLFVGLAIFISRAGLSSIPQVRDSYIAYEVTPIGGVLGAILGGLNGFLIITLVKQYLMGTNLPGSSQLPTEIVMTSGGVVTVASPGANIQITNLPGFALFSVLLPWLIIIFVILIIFLRLRSRFGPWNYHQQKIESKKDEIVFVPLLPVEVKK
jgi:hypothetical protein